MPYYCCIFAIFNKLKSIKITFIIWWINKMCISSSLWIFCCEFCCYHQYLSSMIFIFHISVISLFFTAILLFHSKIFVVRPLHYRIIRTFPSLFFIISRQLSAPTIWQLGKNNFDRLRRCYCLSCMEQRQFIQFRLKRERARLNTL
jgi:hypothetical protein